MSGATVILSNGKVTGVRAAEKFRKRDAAWFAKRPHRRVRFRDPYPGELRELIGRDSLETSGYPTIVAVVQLRPGVRTRRVLATRLRNEPEAVLMAYLHLAEMSAEQGYSGELSSQDLLAAVGVSPAWRH